MKDTIAGTVRASTLEEYLEQGYLGLTPGNGLVSAIYEDDSRTTYPDAFVVMKYYPEYILLVVYGGVQEEIPKGPYVEWQGVVDGELETRPIRGVPSTLNWRPPKSWGWSSD